MFGCLKLSFRGVLSFAGVASSGRFQLTMEEVGNTVDIDNFLTPKMKWNWDFWGGGDDEFEKLNIFVDGVREDVPLYP